MGVVRDDSRVKKLGGVPRRVRSSAAAALACHNPFDSVIVSVASTTGKARGDGVEKLVRVECENEGEREKEGKREKERASEKARERERKKNE